MQGWYDAGWLTDKRDLGGIHAHLARHGLLHRAVVIRRVAIGSLHTKTERQRPGFGRIRWPDRRQDVCVRACVRVWGIT